MEFANTDTIEVEEIYEEGNPAKKYRKIVKSYDQKFVTDWKNDPNYKSWVEKPKKDDEGPTVTYTFEAVDANECIELHTEVEKPTEVKTVRKAVVAKSTTPVKNSRAKSQIKILDPNQPAFVCTEHNENISLDCRYCRIASGFKKKNSQKTVQNDEISSTGKVTVAIPKRDVNIHAKKSAIDAAYDRSGDSPSVSGDQSSKSRLVSLKYAQKFRTKWLDLPEFKDWLVECKLSDDDDTSQALCKFCGTLFVNNSNNLVRHAISKKHTKNMELENTDVDAPRFQGAVQTLKTIGETKSKEEIFGNYVASELKRIKNKKTYEEVKWKILQALQSAVEKEADDQATT